MNRFTEDYLLEIKERIKGVEQAERVAILTDVLCQLWSTHDDADFIKRVLMLLIEIEVGRKIRQDLTDSI